MNVPINHRGDAFQCALFPDLARFIAHCPECASLLCGRLATRALVAAQAEKAYVGTLFTPAHIALVRRAESTQEVLRCAREYRTSNRAAGWPCVRSDYDFREKAAPDCTALCPAMRPDPDMPMTLAELINLRFSHAARVQAMARELGDGQ